MDRAELPSCARVMVSVSPAMFVTRTTSAFDARGDAPVGHTVALNGTAGNREPCPLATTSDVPDAAGLGAVATEEYAKFLWASTSVPHVGVQRRNLPLRLALARVRAHHLAVVGLDDHELALALDHLVWPLVHDDLVTWLYSGTSILHDGILDRVAVLVELRLPGPVSRSSATDRLIRLDLRLLLLLGSSRRRQATALEVEPERGVADRTSLKRGDEALELGWRHPDSEELLVQLDAGLRRLPGISSLPSPPDVPLHHVGCGQLDGASYRAKRRVLAGVTHRHSRRGLPDAGLLLEKPSPERRHHLALVGLRGDEGPKSAAGELQHPDLGTLRQHPRHAAPDAELASDGDRVTTDPRLRKSGEVPSVLEVRHRAVVRQVDDGQVVQRRFRDLGLRSCRANERERNEVQRLVESQRSGPLDLLPVPRRVALSSPQSLLIDPIDQLEDAILLGGLRDV